MANKLVLGETAGEYTDKINKLIDEFNAGGGGGSEEYIPVSQKGAKDGVASLDSDGKVPSSQLPSQEDYVKANGSLTKDRILLGSGDKIAQASAYTITDDGSKVGTSVIPTANAVATILLNTFDMMIRLYSTTNEGHFDLALNQAEGTVTFTTTKIFTKNDFVLGVFDSANLLRVPDLERITDIESTQAGGYKYRFVMGWHYVFTSGANPTAREFRLMVMTVKEAG